MSDDLREASQRKLNFPQTVRAVLWSFLGIRRSRGYAEDAARLNPVYVILAGLCAAGLFVGILVLVVRMVVA